MDVLETARKHALKNALAHGKASQGAVMGKVLAELPTAKEDMKTTAQAIAKAIAQVNSLTPEQIASEAAGYPDYEKPVEEKKIKLQGAEEGRVVTRFLPEPNGYPHIGHAKASWLSRQAADDYSGKCILRFDDTNPEAEKLEFVGAIKDDLAWLGLKFDEPESYTSDLMPALYDCAHKIIDSGNAYVCTCVVEEVRKNRELQKACACRGKTTAENRVDFEKMKNGGFREGQAILRLKGDMAALNTVMRDPTLYRIIEATHYRQGEKYKAWPTYDFEVSITDSLNGVTHALRSKEYELRDELYYRIIELAGLRKPVVYDFARLNIRGTLLSKRFLKPLIEQGKVMGWDDPRLPTISGLRRRGILPQAIKNFVLSFGLSKVESEPSWDALLTENRRILEDTAEHYFFAREPVELVVEGVTPNLQKTIDLPKHHKLEKGVRNVRVGNKFFISKTDSDELKTGEVFRLKELYNVRVKEKTASGIIGEFAGLELVSNSKKLTWVSGEQGEFLHTNILVPSDIIDEQGEFRQDSLETVKGVCEKDCGKLKVGDIIQFERFGFCRFDDETKIQFVYSC